MVNYLIIGQGSIGKEVTKQISRHHHVVGLSRTTKCYDGVMNAVHWQMDALDLKPTDLQDFTHIAVIVTPSAITDRIKAYQDSYLAICQHLAGMSGALVNLRRILFVSSTSVYSEQSGELVDEHTMPNPLSPTAKVLLEAENAIVHAFTDQAVIVRPSGIYGIDRLRMIRSAQSAHDEGVPRCHHTNRIMDTDLVAVLVRILLCDVPKPLYLATDHCPASSYDVLRYLCGKMQILPPKVIDEPVSGKQIISNLPKDWLEFDDYQKGYAFILQKLNLIGFDDVHG